MQTEIDVWMMLLAARSLLSDCYDYINNVTSAADEDPQGEELLSRIKNCRQSLQQTADGIGK